MFIVDEAHRSTFGTMLRDIKLTYPRAMFFGFTGTPIMKENAVDGITTDGLFGTCLHKYTISEGIRDKNVLGFKPSKVVTFDEEDFREKVALMKLGKDSVEGLTDEEFKNITLLLPEIWTRWKQTSATVCMPTEILERASQKCGSGYS